MSNKHEMTLQQIMKEQGVENVSQKLVRRKLRATFTASHNKNDRWTFKVGSREYNKLINEVLSKHKKVVTRTETEADDNEQSS